MIMAILDRRSSRRPDPAAIDTGAAADTAVRLAART
jgi:hypothetical protein